ncbi:MAG: FAD-dependent oxidoreductase [Magnetovibrio sp.]|nr:FAD-dependent oxidoreductase [Magnetovibrio sp.]
MSQKISCDICVIGGGAGGLSVAAGASQMGADVVLVEKSEMGGDCLNTGCVPSKALLAAGHAAFHAAHTDQFGITAGKVSINGKKVFEHVRGVIETIAPNDSVERFEGLGVNVVKAHGRFTGPKTLVAGDQEITAKYFVVSTRSSAFVPPIDGLRAISPLTNENIFDLTEIPKHLIIIGGGPIGCEMAQAFRHLGARVTVLELFSIMPKDDPELADVIRQHLLKDGIDLFEGCKVDRVQGSKNAPEVVIEDSSGTGHIIKGSHLLVAAGRRVNVQDLGLEAAKVDFSPRGIEIDRRLRSVSNKRVFAIGDVAGGFQFTHVAGYHAGIVIRNTLFKLPAKANLDTVPWVTYTEPELSNVGLSEALAREKYGADVRVLNFSFDENDRATAEHNTDGKIKAIVTQKGKILGCSIVGPRAGDLIAPWVLAMEQNLKIGALASTISPYPTLGEVSKRAAGSFYTPKLFSDKARKIVKFLMKFS